MHSKYSLKSYLSLVVSALLIAILFAGCTTSRSSSKLLSYNSKVSQRYDINRYMYVSNPYKSFKKGERVRILGVKNSLALTKKGYISRYRLSKSPVVETIKIKKPLQNQKVSLKVIAPQNSKIRILNIKPKYHDNIMLNKGNYHIEVTKPGYQMYKKWITVNKDLDYNIGKLKPKVKPLKIADGKYECTDDKENIFLEFKTIGSNTTWDMFKKSSPMLTVSSKLKKSKKATSILNVIKNNATYSLNIQVTNIKTKNIGNKNIGTFFKEGNDYIFNSKGKKLNCKKI